MLRFVKNRIDSALDRVASHLAGKISAQLIAPKGADVSVVEMEPVLRDFNHYLHELRSNELSRMPRDGGIRTLLSAGCSGAWYFDWIEREYGTLDKHIGIECYMPKPDRLPPYVEWISNTVGARWEEVADESVDMVFSGQNIEHLQFDDLVGFIVEANRVLRKDGWLIIDSPNRLVTAPLKWLQPEHIAEYTISEIEEMLSAAGFRTEQKRGILLMRESRDQAPWPINFLEHPWKNNDGWLRRAVNACSRPDESFLWWLETRKQSGFVNEELFRSCFNLYSIPLDRNVLSAGNNEKGQYENRMQRNRLLPIGWQRAPYKCA